MKNIKVFLQDILESINLIEKYTQGLSKEEFLDKERDNIQMKDAIIRRLAIIGEAVNNIPNNFREEYSNIPWREISGMRNILVHEYFGVKMERVWKTTKEDLPDLREKINNILKELE
jgi:uncharacterized protein with HEPN domain